MYVWKMKKMKEFCNLQGLTSLNNKPTYYKNPESSTCIDLNCNKLRKDVSKLVYYRDRIIWFAQNGSPKIVTYRKYRFFSNECFREDLIKVLSNNEVSNDNDDFGKSFSIWRKVLNNYALRKGTYLRGTTIRLTFFLYNYVY